jgi:HEAT repeat protein
LKKNKRKRSTLLLLIVGFGIPAYFVYELASSDRLEMKRILVYLNSGEIPKQTRALDSFEDYAKEAFPKNEKNAEELLSEDQKNIRRDLEIILGDVVRFCANRVEAQQVLIRCGWALQNFADRSSVRMMLVDLLTHEDKMVRYNSALALARKGDDAAKTVIQTMVAPSERDRKTRYSAAIQLHNITGEEDIEWIRTLLYTEREPRIKEVLKLLLEGLEGVPDARR